MNDTPKPNQCQATMFDRESCFAARGAYPVRDFHRKQYRKRCPHPGVTVRWSRGRTPRLVCGTHAKSDNVQWSADVTIDLDALDEGILFAIAKFWEEEAIYEEQCYANLIAYHESRVAEITAGLAKARSTQKKRGL